MSNPMNVLDWLICELELDIWVSLMRQYNGYGLAKRINRLESYRLYDRRYPRDKFDKMLSLDSISEAGIDLHYQVPHDNPTPQSLVESEQLVAQYRQSLTKRQRLIVDMLGQGFTQPEIAEHLGYRGTGVIRYQKHLAKQKWILLNNKQEA